MMKQMQEENKRMAQEKKDRENAWNGMQQAENAAEIADTDGSHLMTENTGTCTSGLAAHRFLPYHFKGLRPEQKEQIMAERQQ